MYICEICREQVQPASQNVTYAIRLHRPDSIVIGVELTEGPGVFFHTRCYPVGSRRYRRQPIPGNVDDE